MPARRKLRTAPSPLGYRLRDLPFGNTKAHAEINAGRLIVHRLGRLDIVLPEDWRRYVELYMPQVNPADRGRRA
jgi:hypothetical protein